MGWWTRNDGREGPSPIWAGSSNPSLSDPGYRTQWKPNKGSMKATRVWGTDNIQHLLQKIHLKEPSPIWAGSSNLISSLKLKFPSFCSLFADNETSYQTRDVKSFAKLSREPAKSPPPSQPARAVFVVFLCTNLAIESSYVDRIPVL